MHVLKIKGFKMKYYPVCLDIKGKNCLVVGGGRVGSRKADRLLQCGARVRVISRDFSEKLEKGNSKGELELIRRDYNEGDLDGIFLVIAATDSQKLNRFIQEDAEKRKILYNIADFPEGSNFVLPAIVHRGDLVITVSTSGKSPAFAKQMRKELESLYGEEYGRFLSLMGEIREKLLSEKHDPEEHKDLFAKLVDGGLLKMVSENNSAEINSLLESVLGDRLSNEELAALSE
jgi:precorrin-2 dehydrogenase/sirohydrochlorin ferrochelatase